MAKPATLDGYRAEHTADCERVLVTLLRGLGPWKESVYLVGGLTPRYLVAARPPVVPAHAGTLDGGDVHEHILAAVVRLDEPKTLLRIKPLDRSDCHHALHSRGGPHVAGRITFGFRKHRTGR